jgi:hypothetical protein
MSSRTMRNGESGDGSMTTLLCLIFLVFSLCVPGQLHAQGTDDKVQSRQGRSTSPSFDPSKFVVFIHMGGRSLDRLAILRIGIALSKKGYVVRAPDRDQDEVGGPGVDYFSDSARDAAQDVANAMNEVLREMKLQDKDDSRKLRPRLQGTKNPPGYLGVWLF